MRDPYLTFVEASRITGVDRRTLAAMPSLQSGAPADKLDASKNGVFYAA